MTDWQTVSHLPDAEPQADNLAAYRRPQLMAGASSNGQFIYDVVYAEQEHCFVLTLMEIDEQWGFVAQQVRLYPQTRGELLQYIQKFEQQPATSLNAFQAA